MILWSFCVQSQRFSQLAPDSSQSRFFHTAQRAKRRRDDERKRHGGAHRIARKREDEKRSFLAIGAARNRREGCRLSGLHHHARKENFAAEIRDDALDEISIADRRASRRDEDIARPIPKRPSESIRRRFDVVANVFE
jgi:hypothetical protein